MSVVLKSGLKAAFTTLKSLRLSVEYRCAKDEEKSNPEWRSWLQDFVELMPRLERLSLVFAGLDFTDFPAANRVPFSKFLNGTTLQHLGYLELANGFVQPTALRQFFRCHAKTLRELVLRRIAFFINDSSEHDEDVDYGPNSWPGILRELTTNNDSLRSLKFACLYSMQSNRVLSFLQDGLKDCATCQTPWHHQSNVYREIDCEHVSYESETGQMPADLSYFSIDGELRNPSVELPEISESEDEDSEDESDEEDEDALLEQELREERLAYAEYAAEVRSLAF